MNITLEQKETILKSVELLSSQITKLKKIVLEKDEIRS